MSAFDDDYNKIIGLNTEQLIALIQSINKQTFEYMQNERLFYL